jgi:hypothetical protein
VRSLRPNRSSLGESKTTYSIIQFGDNVKPYLCDWLTRTGVVKVFTSLDTALREHGDTFIKNPA